MTQKDNIIKGLEGLVEREKINYAGDYPDLTHEVTLYTFRNAIDLITTQQTEIKEYKEMVWKDGRTIATQQKEIERITTITTEWIESEGNTMTGGQAIDLIHSVVSGDEIYSTHHLKGFGDE